MEFRDLLLTESGFANTPGGFKVQLRLPRYRSLPLSCVRPEHVDVDGERFGASAIRFRIGDHTYRIEELADHFDDWWFILDDAELLVDRPAALEPGEHDVEVLVALRIPYVFVDGGRRSVEESLQTRKRLVLETEVGE